MSDYWVGDRPLKPCPGCSMPIVFELTMCEDCLVEEDEWLNTKSSQIAQTLHEGTL